MNVIEVVDVSKAYRLGFKLNFGLKKNKEKMPDCYWALKDISLSVTRGETVGVIGINGSGKSTLLSLLMGSLKPTIGKVTTQGRVSGLLELGAGFHPDFTGMENIKINAAILGVSKTELEKQMQEIIAFAEIGEFIHMPCRTYSSGMGVRLGFAVATMGTPEILLIDEALSVGDINFARKCVEHIRMLRDKGVTIIFVSHDLGGVQNLCQRTVWLKDGAIAADGPSKEVIERYLDYTRELAGLGFSRRFIKQGGHAASERKPETAEGQTVRHEKTDEIEFIEQEQLSCGSEWEAHVINEDKVYWSTPLRQPTLAKTSYESGTIFKNGEPLQFMPYPESVAIACGKVENGYAIISQTAHDPNAAYSVDYLAVHNPDAAVLKFFDQIEVLSDLRHGNQEVIILNVSFYNADGLRADEFFTGDSLTIHVDFFAKRKVVRPSCGGEIWRNDNLLVMSWCSKADGASPDHIIGIGAIKFSIPNVRLLPGTYFVTIGIYDEEILQAKDYHNKLYSFRVSSKKQGRGVFMDAVQYNFQC